jgi:hypothetical protein
MTRMSVNPSLESVAYSISRRDADPLSFWHFSVPRIREAFRLFTSEQPITELHLRGPNRTGKSQVQAAWAIRCAQKAHDLDGVALPRWSGPVHVVQIVLDYKRQALSVQPAYLSLLGRWPHKARYLGPSLQSIHIKPVDGTDDETTWSIIHFLSAENRDAGVGIRADVICFDEPPPIELLRELRKAGHAGRRSIRVIGETPELRRLWQPMRDEYGDTPRDMLRRVQGTRWAECRWNLMEVDSRILSAEEKEAMLIEYGRDRKIRDPLYDARVYGDYCDVSGSCPFDVDTLLKLRDRCREPGGVHWPIRLEGSEQMHEARSARLEIWKRAQKGKNYWVTIDPSSGVDDEAHDPYELQVVEVGSGDLCLRSGGHLSGLLVGTLAASLCRQYNGAIADPEVNDRWGVNVVEGFHRAGYSNFAREQRELRPGVYASEIGFHNTAKSRPMIIGAVQGWVEAARAGAPHADCPSRFILDQLLDAIVDPTGKIVAGPGCHDDALIAWGESLRRTVRHSQIAQAKASERRPSTSGLAALIRGGTKEQAESRSRLLTSRLGRL